jgi:hypothetical protein
MICYICLTSLGLATFALTIHSLHQTSSTPNKPQPQHAELSQQTTIPRAASTNTASAVVVSRGAAPTSPAATLSPQVSITHTSPTASNPTFTTQSGVTYPLRA